MDSLLAGICGLPRVDGSDDPRRGLDCSGVVREVYRRLGRELPAEVDLRKLEELASSRWRSIERDEIRPLDVLVSRSPETGLHYDVVVSERYVLTANMRRCGFRRLSDVSEPLAILRYEDTHGA